MLHSVEPTGDAVPDADRSLRHALDLVGVLADLARSWEAESIDRLPHAIVGSAAIAIPGVHRASISLLASPPALATVAQTDDLIAATDQLQYDLGEGPSVDAALRRDTFRTGDLARDGRWPAFAPTAAQLGLRSVLSLHLYVIGRSLGSLNLASGQAMAFDEEAEQLGRLFASHAAIALSGAQREHHLSEALSARDRIGQAKGILMERHQLTDDEAFDLLVSASQNTNIKVRDIATHVIHDVGRPFPSGPGVQRQARTGLTR